MLLLRPPMVMGVSILMSSANFACAASSAKCSARCGINNDAVGTYITDESVHRCHLLFDNV